MSVSSRSKVGLVVALGASAGGLAAFRTFLANMPHDTGMAFVLLQHLDPHNPSALVGLLAPHTRMRITQAENGDKLAANCVYVIPPDATLTIKGGTLELVRPAPPREERRPIDTFFASLAKDQGEWAASIVLSGVGSDGAAGLRAVKAQGGLTLAQAEFDETAMSGMPTSAVATGSVDYIMPIEAMPEKLMAHQDQLKAIRQWQETQANSLDWHRYLDKITALLRNAVGHDFAGYKEMTIIRRIQRRMQHLNLDSVVDYVERLEADALEADLLFRELLIGVTQFFRDPHAFEALSRSVFPTLFHDRHADDPIRAWVAGCATGEEVYSLAILVKEAMAAANLDMKVQIFGTDLDTGAVAVARAGRYRSVEGMPPERLRRWFVSDGVTYSPIKEIREMCIFSMHSLIKDPPFSKLDLISCRNVLIYFNSELQQRIVQTFHYALRPAGYLFLGSSEGVARDAGLFSVLDKPNRILQRRDDVAPSLVRPKIVIFKDVSKRSASRLASEDSVDQSARDVIEPYSPIYFVIDRDRDVVRFSGPEAGQYIEPSWGTASLNLFSILRRALRPDVREGVLAVEFDRRSYVKELATSGPDGRPRAVSLIVEPIEAGMIVVAFRELIASRDLEQPATHERLSGSDLEQELRTVKVQLAAATRELETYMEEAKSATEEMQSVNEELQSSNEELETSKEEMQSINEELQTLNGELQSKNDSLSRANDDLQNLLDSTQIATLFLDKEFHIRNFTPAMTTIFHVREGDIGRPITDIVSKLSYEGLEQDAEAVQRSLGVIEREVTLRDGKSKTFLLRIRPYRTIDDRLDGVVLTFLDISAVKHAQHAADQLASIVQWSNDAIISEDLSGTITSWNSGAERLLGYTRDERVGKSMSSLVPSGYQDDRLALLARIQAGDRLARYETVWLKKDGGHVNVTVAVSPVKDIDGRIIGVSKIADQIGSNIE